MLERALGKLLETDALGESCTRRTPSPPTTEDVFCTNFVFTVLKIFLNLRRNYFVCPSVQSLYMTSHKLISLYNKSGTFAGRLVHLTDSILNFGITLVLR